MEYIDVCVYIEACGTLYRGRAGFIRLNEVCVILDGLKGGFQWK